MPIYAGETVRVFVSALGWDDEPLQVSTVEDVTLDIYDSWGTPLFEEPIPMDYIRDEQGWRFSWLYEVAGTYKLVVTVHGPGTDVSRDVRTISLERPLWVQRPTSGFLSM